MNRILPYTEPIELKGRGSAELHVAQQHLPSYLLQEIGRLRVNAWQTIAGLAPSTTGDTWLDDLEAESYHFYVVFDGVLIAASRLSLITDIAEVTMHAVFREYFTPEPPFWYLTRLVVHPEYQKLGLMHKLDAIRWTTARQILPSTRVYTITNGQRTEYLLNMGFLPAMTGHVPEHLNDPGFPPSTVCYLVL